MKKSIFLPLLICLALSLQGKAQKVASSFTKAEGTTYAMPLLDAQYQSAIHSDSSLAVFKGDDQNKLILAYQKLLQELGHHLAQNNFKWEKPTRCFNRFYFNQDGSIDYYLFHFNPAEVGTQKQEEFAKLMTGFIQNHRLTLQAPVKFSQCSPVVYQD